MHPDRFQLLLFFIQQNACIRDILSDGVALGWADLTLSIGLFPRVSLPLVLLMVLEDLYGLQNKE